MSREILAENILARLGERRQEETPDYLELNQLKSVPVFVYGTLKRGGRLSDALKDVPTLGRGVSSLRGYRMADSGSGFPVLFRHSGSGASVAGEVYLCDAATIARLDQIEANGSMYHREQIPVTLRDQKDQMNGSTYLPTIRCWTYFGDIKFWKYGAGMKFFAAEKLFLNRPVVEYNHLQKSGRPFNDQIPF